MVGTGAEYAAAMVLAVVLGRSLGPAAYGLLPLAMSVADIPRTIALSGFGTSLVRSVAAIRAKEPVPRSLLRDGALLVLGSSAVAAAALWLLADQIARVFGQPALAGLMRPMAILVFAAGFVSLASSMLQGYSEVREMSQMLTLVSILRLVLAIGLAIGLGLSIAGAAWGNALAYLIVGTVAAAIFAQRWAASARGGASYFRQVSGYSVPLLASWFAAYGVSRVDMIFVGYFVRNVSQIAFFSIATAMAAVPFILVQATATALSPVVTGLHAAGDRDRLQRLYVISQRAMLLTFLPISAVAFFGATPVLRLLLPQYLPSAPYVQLLSLSFAIRAMGGIASGAFFLPMGRAADVARFTAVGATFNVALDVLLIPLLGAMGSVIGTVLVMSSLNGYALLRVRDRLELNGLQRTYCLKAVAGATAMVLTMGVGTLGLRAIPFDIGGWLAIAAGLGVYVGVAWLWGLVSAEDVGALRAAFSREIA